MKIALTVGHSLLKNGQTTSAVGLVNEYYYNRELAPYVKKWLEHAGHQVTLIQIPEKTHVSAKQEESYKLTRINGKGFDLVCELHLNCFNKTAQGAEVLYKSESGKRIAQRVQNKLKTQFKDRGVKQRTDLYILRDTEPVAILLETFFCDNATDYKKATSLGYDGVAKLIAEGIHGADIKASTTTTTTNTVKKKYYRVVVGSYSNRTNADKALANAKAKGFNSAFLDVFEKKYYRVVVGSYSDRTNADKALANAKAKGFNSAFLDVFEK